jgi:hypothetical protein
MRTFSARRLKAADDMQKSSRLPLLVLCALFLFGLALCGAYIFLADKFCPLEAPPSSKPHSWIVKFFCEAKAADVALVFFTYGLMIVTGWLAWATLKLWKAGESQLIVAKEAADAALLGARAAIGIELLSG